MRLRFIAASVPAALLSIACDNTIDDRAPTVASSPSGVIDLSRIDFERKPIGARDDQRHITRPGKKLGLEAARPGGQPTTPAPNEPAPEPPPEVDVCQATLGKAFEAIDGARRDAAAGCQSDAQCVVEVAPTSCGGVDIFAVSFAQRGAFLAAIDGIDKDLCDSLGAGCPITSACFFGTPIATCDDGACRLDFVEPTDASSCNASPDQRDTVEGCVSCGLASQKAGNALLTLVDEMAACEVDGDCAHVSDDTGCGSACGAAINKDNIAAYEAARAEIQTDWCTGGDCPVYMAGCIAQEPRCNAGRCELVGAW